MPSQSPSPSERMGSRMSLSEKSETTRASSTHSQAVREKPQITREWRAWACLFGCFLLMFNSWGLVNAYGTYSSYYRQHLVVDAGFTLLNLVGTTESFMVLILSGVVGRLLDAGLSRWLLGIGGVLVTLGEFMLSISNGEGYNEGNYGLIWLTQGFIVGLGMSCFFVSSSQICSTWFPHHKGLVIGFVASGASISGLIYPVMLKELMVKVGFNNAVRYVSILTAVTCLTSFFLARPNPRHPTRMPEKWMVKKVWIDSDAFSHKSYTFFSISISVLFFGFYAVFFNLEEWAADGGFGVKDATPSGFRSVELGPEEVDNDAIRTFWLLAIMNAASTGGRVGAAFLSDRLGALNLHIGATSISALLVLILWPLASTVNHAIAFVVLFGIFSGAVIGLPPASVANIQDSSGGDHARLGQWVGMMYTLAGVPALTGPIIAGYLIGKYNNYLTVQLWAGICMALTAILMACSRYCLYKEMRHRRNSDATLVGDEASDPEKALDTMNSTATNTTGMNTPMMVSPSRSAEQLSPPVPALRHDDFNPGRGRRP